ncbi:MAG: hypothetical protein AB7J13_07670 [Pyrinomonadaceae bacterium]
MARSLQLLFAASRGRPGGRRHPFAAELITAFSLLIFANSTPAQAVQTDSIYRLPAGTRITVKLEVELSSKVASVNDTFLARVAKPLRVRETVVIPEDTVLEGRVVQASKATSGLTNGQLDVIFETLRISGTTRDIDGTIVNPVEPPSSSTASALSIIGGAVAGGLIGSRSSGSRTLIGAGIGAGIGTGIAFLRKGNEIRIPKDEEFEIKLKTEVVLPVLDY